MPDVTKYENKCVSSCLRSQEQAKREEGKGVRAKEMLRRCVKAERDPDTGTGSHGHRDGASEKPREITRYICQWYDVSYDSIFKLLLHRFKHINNILSKGTLRD